ncbi:MAG: type I restriction enzyme HsdR N-terminal domain-containing protein [Flavobacterium sp.]
MQKLNYSDFTFRFKQKDNVVFIFDEIRKKFVVLTPEEWVRQHVVHFLVYEKKYPKNYVNVEKQINVNGTIKRYDVVVFDALGNYDLLVECKAPQVQITQNTFDQIARYNFSLQANILMVTNGLNHYFCKINPAQNGYLFLQDLPSFKSKNT